MPEVVVLGGGVAGHAAALHLKKQLKNKAKVTVITPNADWNWIPSNIWVGVGAMKEEQVLFPLAPVYKKKNVNYFQAKATEIHPYGTVKNDKPGVTIEYTGQGKAGQKDYVPFDYLINATGPALRFDMTEGLGPDNGFTASVCTADHATHAAKELAQVIEKAKKGERQTIVIGTGHGTCTCQGAAFEYVFNVEHQVREAGLRDLVRIIYMSNEAELGDFGVGGMTFIERGFETSSKMWAKSLFRERGVEAIIGSAVHRIEKNKISYETLDGESHELAFNYAMLLPPFGGVPLKAFDKNGEDISEQMFAPSGFMKVDADYSQKPFEQWRAEDWPKTYECPNFENIFDVGIAFAPPHQISKPRETPNGTVIAPAPPRTGMPAGVTGKAVALTIVDRIKNRARNPHEASLANMGAACVASVGTGLRKGSAASMTMMPVVPDYEKYDSGRDTKMTRGQVGLHGHWVKLMLHYLFIYKAKGYPFWWLIPE